MLPSARVHVAQGGKMFEEPSFSSGLLEIPPNAVKNYEITTQAEVSC